MGIPAFRWLAATVVILTAAVRVAAQVREETQDAVKEKTAPALDLTQTDAIVRRVQAMDVRERVAQLMLVTLGGRANPDTDDRTLLARYTPAGVVIPALKAPGDAAAYCNDLRAFEAASGIPLWIGANMAVLWRGEREAPSEFQQLPSLLSLAAVNDVEAVKFVAEAVADYLVTMGFNFHLGPYLELPPALSEAQGSLQSLGSDVEFVGATACTFLDVLGERGIVTMPMGFPGGGANRLSNKPAVLLTPEPLLRKADLRPFVSAIDHGARILNVGHVLTPTLDPADVPACLSPSVVGGLLREELRFTGVVVAGPLDMPHIGAEYDFPKAAIRAIKAGADILYWNVSGRRVMRVVDEMVEAVKTGDLPEAMVNAAVTRILTLKVESARGDREAPKAKEAEKLNKRKDNAKESARWERRSITLVQNRDQTLPLTKQTSAPVGVTGVIGVRELAELLHKELKAITIQPITTARHIGDIQDFEIHRIASRLGGMRTAICLFTNDMRATGPAQVIHALKGGGTRVVVVLLGYPGDLPALAEADAILLAYCHTSAYGKTIAGLADVLLGRGAVAIDTPDVDIRVGVGQTRAFNALDVARCPAGRLPVSLAEPYAAGLAVSYDLNRAIKKMEWDFGDGKRAKDLRATHAYEKPGRYPVTVTATDTTGEAISGTFHVLVE